MSDLKINNIVNSKKVVFLGESGFPIGLATIQRLTLMAKALVHIGYMVEIICRKGVHGKNIEKDFPIMGNFEGVDYRYTVKSIYRPKGFIERNIQKVKGIYGEYKYLKSMRKVDLLIVSEMKVVHVLRFIFYSFLFDIPIVMNFVEMTSSMKHRRKLSKKINDFILDKWVMKMFDGALPISNQLMEYYHKIASSKPRLKLPILCDFDQFDIKTQQGEPYFLYCGSFRYKEVRDFVVEAYKRITTNEHTKLYMIISGGGFAETEHLQTQLNSMFKSDAIKIFANIPYDELIALYKNAIALLIPLRNTLQDASRFPHKIGEYLAAGNPVITTNVGEIKTYFKDEENGLVAESYDVPMFAEKMKFVLDNPEKAKKIGLKGQEMGLVEFDYKIHGQRLFSFIADLANYN